MRTVGGATRISSRARCVVEVTQFIMSRTLNISLSNSNKVINKNNTRDREMNRFDYVAAITTATTNNRHSLLLINLIS